MTQDAQSVTQEQDMSWFDIAIDNRGNAVILDYAPGWKDHAVEFYWEDTFTSDPPKHLAVGAYRWIGFKVGFWGEDEHLNVTGGEFIPHRLAPQPTSAEDAVAWMYQGEGQLFTTLMRQEWRTDWTETPLYTRPTPDAQTAAIGAEAEDTRLVCEQCGKAGALFCDHVSRGAAYLSQPVAAPQAEMAGDDYRQKLRMVISHASGGHLSDEADVERSINDICVQISQHHNRVWEAALEKGRKEVTPPQPEGGTVAESDLRETFNYLCKWVERGLFDKKITVRQALECIAYHPGLPWMKGRWDVDHKPYAAEFYKAFPKAALQPEKTK